MFRSPLKPFSGGPWPYFATLVDWNVDLYLLYVFFWVIPRRLILFADVSEHCSIFIGKKVNND
jgi:hypothetical protein